VPTVPEAEELSPYEICQLDPALFLNVLDLVGSKMVWLPAEVVLFGSSVDHIYCFVSSTTQVIHGLTYPEISGSCVEVQGESLAWRPNGDRAEVLGVILRVLCRDLASLVRAYNRLLKDLLHGGLPTNRLGVPIFALVDGFVANDVWTLLSRCELVFMKERDIGLGTRTLILLVVDEVYPLKLSCHGDRRRGRLGPFVGPLEELVSPRNDVRWTSGLSGQENVDVLMGCKG